MAWSITYTDKHLTRFSGDLVGRFLPMADVYVAGAIKFAVKDMATGCLIAEDFAIDLDNAKETAERAAKNFALRTSRGFTV